MNIPTGVSAMLQVIAALLIFVASYLGLVLCTIACLAVAELFSQRADVVREYGAKNIPVTPEGISAMGGEARPSRFTFRRQIPKRI
jgi:hypothetical protein